MQNNQQNRRFDPQMPTVKTHLQVFPVVEICAEGKAWAGGPCKHAAVFSVTFLWEIPHDTCGIWHQSVTDFRSSTLSCPFATRGCHVLKTVANSPAGSFEWRDLRPVSHHAAGVSMRLRGGISKHFSLLTFNDTTSQMFQITTRICLSGHYSKALLRVWMLCACRAVLVVYIMLHSVEQELFPG